MVLNAIELGFLVGAVPTFSMALCSLLFSSVEVSSEIEACFQNFAGGLILAAVGGELFPLMLDASPSNTRIGVTVGMAFGLCIVYGMEHVIEYFENMGEDDDDEPNFSAIGGQNADGTSINPMNEAEDVEGGGAVQMKERTAVKELSDPDLADQLQRESNVFRESTARMRAGSGGENGMLTASPAKAEWEDTDELTIAEKAIAEPKHRSHIQEHLLEISEQIKAMDLMLVMLNSTHNHIIDAENIAEKIDESIHSLQYKMDHCRRLIQGSETGHHQLVTVHARLTVEKKVMMKARLTMLHNIAEHLLEHIQPGEKIDKFVLKEMHEHLDEMEEQVEMFHDHVAHVSSKWHRRKQMPETKEGDKLPVSLIVPVTMDCFTDGFLIGVSVALSRKAGIILGFANMLEMGFLGCAYASRLKRCTGSSFTARILALYLPPIVMLLAAGLGATVASATIHIPAIFISFVAFGTVALLSLVCNELLIEAHEAHAEDEKWWISIQIFAGIYLVLMTADSI